MCIKKSLGTILAFIGGIISIIAYYANDSFIILLGTGILWAGIFEGVEQLIKNKNKKLNYYLGLITIFCLLGLTLKLGVFFTDKTSTEALINFVESTAVYGIVNSIRYAVYNVDNGLKMEKKNEAKI